MATTATHIDRPPIDAYDDLDVRRLVPQLRQRSQVELTSIDDYERSHQDRPAVLDKLRYLRNDEPLEGYDGLDAGQILTALADADATKLGAVREYETRLRDRDEVLSGVARLRKEKQSAQNPDAAAAEPDVVWAADGATGLRGTLATAGVMTLVAAAAGLLLVLLCILLFAVVAAVAPTALT